MKGPTVSKLISYISHPILLPLLGIMAITRFHWISSSKFVAPGLYNLWLLIGLTTILLPIFVIGTLFRKYEITQFVHFNRKERSLSAIMMAAFYLLPLFLIPKEYQDRMIQSYFFAMACTTALAGIINLRYKISFHVIGWAGFMVMLVVLNRQSFNDLFFLLLGLVLWIGIVAWSRLEQQAHKKNEIYTAFLTGAILNTLIYSIAYGL